MVFPRARLRYRTPDIARCIHDVQQRRELVRLIYSSHERWPLPPPDLQSSTNNTPKGIQRNGLRISVLDSSFNPPTLAHLALACSKPPRSSNNPDPDSDYDYDARLLLLSVRNADKGAPKAGEATYAQRLEMMILLAQELEDMSSSNPLSPAIGNIAVAIIDEPTFVRKSIALRRFLQDLNANLDTTGSEAALPAGAPNSVDRENTNTQCRQIKLSFILGFDTLERFLDPRYYNNSLEDMHAALPKFFEPPPDGDGSEIVCAWRGENKPENVDSREEPLQTETPASESRKKMKETLSIAQPFVASGRVSFTLLTNYEMTLSSSEVRAQRSEGRSHSLTMVPSRVGYYIKEAELYA